MAASPVLSWAQLLEQATANISQAGVQPSAEILKIKTESSGQPRGDASLTGAVSPPTNAAERHDDSVVDWMGTLDIVSGLGSRADEQKKRLLDQGDAHHRDITELRRELSDLLQQTRVSVIREQEAKAQAAIRLQELQVRADARVEEIRADAEARVQIIRVDAEAKIRVAEDRARVAELRAETAEKWLQRISDAAKRQVFG